MSAPSGIIPYRIKFIGLASGIPIYDVTGDDVAFDWPVPEGYARQILHRFVQSNLYRLQSVRLCNATAINAGRECVADVRVDDIGNTTAAAWYDIVSKRLAAKAAAYESAGTC